MNTDNTYLLPAAEMSLDDAAAAAQIFRSSHRVSFWEPAPKGAGILYWTVEPVPDADLEILGMKKWTP